MRLKTVFKLIRSNSLIRWISDWNRNSPIFIYVIYRVSYLRVCKMNQFWQKEGAWKKFILSLICDVYKCTFMDLYQFSSQFCPCSLYEPIFEKLHFHLKILFLEKPLKTFICKAVKILVVYKHPCDQKFIKISISTKIQQFQNSVAS